MAKIKIYGYISTDAAVAAGNIVAGDVEIDITEDWLAGLTAEELEAVKDTCCTWPLSPPYGGPRLGHRSNCYGTRYMSDRYIDKSLTEPTLEAALVVIRDQLRQQAESRKTAADQKLVEAAELRELADTLADANDDDLVRNERYSYESKCEWVMRGVVEQVKSIAPEIVARAQAICDRRNADEAEKKKERDIAKEAKKAAKLVAAEAHAGLVENWIERCCSQSQKDRHAEGLLPGDELWAAIRDWVFAAANDMARYERLRSNDIEHSERCYGDCDVNFEVEDAEGLIAEQYEWLQRIRKEMKSSPISGIVATPRCHRAWPDCDDDAIVKRYSALVTCEFAGRKLSREYAL